MNTKKRRSRIVSFRLSDEEYDSLKNISESNGARNVSEFTRSAAFGSGENTNEDKDKLEETLAHLREAVEMLNDSTQTLTRVFESSKKN